MKRQTIQLNKNIQSYRRICFPDFRENYENTRPKETSIQRKILKKKKKIFLAVISKKNIRNGNQFVAIFFMSKSLYLEPLFSFGNKMKEELIIQLKDNQVMQASFIAGHIFLFNFQVTFIFHFKKKCLVVQEDIS